MSGLRLERQADNDMADIGAGNRIDRQDGGSVSGMGKHSALTKGQRWLLVGFAALGAVLTPLSFLVMFLTVNALLGPYMDGWAWAVPVGTEAGFLGLFFADILLEARRRPALLLHVAPYAFAVVSLWLNAAAAHGDVVGMVGHSVLPMVFFGYLLAAKLLARRLSVSDRERQLEMAVSDAVAHARDILRSADRWWRLRAPVLLRRQLRSRRLPATVMAAIKGGIGDGGASRWEPVVESWITRSLALPEGVSALLTAARAEASESALQSDSRSAPQDTLAVTPEVTPVAPPETPPVVPPEVPARRRRVVPAKATNDQLADLILDAVEDPSELNPYKVNKTLKEHCGGKGVGEARAALLVDLAQRKHRERRVVPMARRA